MLVNTANICLANNLEVGREGKLRFYPQAFCTVSYLARSSAHHYRPHNRYVFIICIITNNFLFPEDAFDMDSTIMSALMLHTRNQADGGLQARFRCYVEFQAIVLAFNIQHRFSDLLSYHGSVSII